jgi:hypothetical protein
MSMRVDLIWENCSGSWLQSFGINARTVNKIKVAQKFYKTIIYKLLTNLLYNYLNVLKWQVDGCVTCLIFLCNLHQFQQPCCSNKQEHLSSSSSRLNFEFTTTFLPLHDFVITSKHFSISVLQREGNLREQDLGFTVGRAKESLQVFWFLFRFSNLCVVVHCGVEKNFLSIFLRSNSP